MDAPGTVTTIGSLPHVDPAEAASFALAGSPQPAVRILPAAPSLPVRSPLEAMIAQAAWGVPGVDVDAGGVLRIVGGGPDPDGAAAPIVLTEEPWRGLAAFLDAAAGLGAVKLQLAGPVTLGRALVAAGVPRHRAYAAAAAAVRSRVRDLVEITALRLPEARIVVFFDEPGLAGAGAGAGAPGAGGGSADLGGPATSDLLATVVRGAGPGVVTGIHCCGEAPWAVLLDAEPDILSLPVECAGRLRPGDLRPHLERGGAVAWGAVPTSGPRPASVERLWHRLAERWHDLVAGGCDPVLVRTRALVTPACGLAGHTEAQAAAIVATAAALGGRVAEGAVAALG